MPTTSPFRWGAVHSAARPWLLCSHACLHCTPPRARAGCGIAGQCFQNSRRLPAQSENLTAVEERLRKLDVPYIKTQVEEGGVRVTQVHRSFVLRCPPCV